MASDVVKLRRLEDGSLRNRVSGKGNIVRN